MEINKQITNNEANDVFNIQRLISIFSGYYGNDPDHCLNHAKEIGIPNELTQEFLRYGNENGYLINNKWNHVLHNTTGNLTITFFYGGITRNREKYGDKI